MREEDDEEEDEEEEGRLHALLFILIRIWHAFRSLSSEPFSAEACEKGYSKLSEHERAHCSLT